MSINVQCPSCSIRRRVNERLAGRTIRCPGCDAPLTIPELAAPIRSPDHAEVDDEIVMLSEQDEAVDAQVVKAEPVAVTAVRGGVGAAAVMVAPVARAAFVPHVPEHPPSALLDDDTDEELPPRKQRDDGELDMTPMVDVTFLLLIFFMVTASFSLQKSIQFPRQNSDLPSMSNVEEETEELDPIELEIEENGGFLVLAPDWERETPGKQNLISTLKQALGANKDGMRLDIKVHENAKLQMLVDAMDAGTIAGFTEIQVAEVDGFD